MPSEATNVEICEQNVHETTTFIKNLPNSFAYNNNNNSNIIPTGIVVDSNTEISLTCDQLTTNAVTRSWSDLHIPTWFALLSANITLRTLIFHPLQMSIQRKRVTRESNPPSVRSLITMAYRGGTCHADESCKRNLDSSSTHEQKVKTLQQEQQKRPHLNESIKKHTSSSASSSHSSPRYDLGKGGVRGLYRGYGAALAANLIGEISFLFALELVKEKVERMVCEQPVDDKHDLTNKHLSSSTTLDEPSITHTDNAVLSSSSSSLPSENNNEFCVDGHSTAIGAMSADFASLFLDTPIIIIANRQITAQYGMAVKNTYRNMRDTFREVWNTYQTSPSHLSCGEHNNNVRWTRKLLCQAQHRARWFANGLRGMYVGTSAGLLRIPSSGCWWTIYVKSKSGLYYLASPVLQKLERKRLEEEAHLLLLSENGNNNHDESSHSNENKRVYEQWRHKKPFWRQNWLLSPTDNPLLNATAASCASVATTLLFNPLAVIQTRLQTLGPSLEQMKLASQTANARHASWSLRKVNPFRKVSAVASDLMKKEGFRGFFKGATANVSVAVMDGVIFSLLFELTKLGSDVEFLERLREDNAQPTNAASSMRVVEGS